MALKVQRLKELRKLEELLGIKFKNVELLNNAFTHKSYVYENKADGFCDNERLEFFGDAVLKLVISEFLYVNYPDLNEGDLTKLRATIVSDVTLAKVSKNSNLGNYLLMSKNEADNGGRTRKSNTANLAEALFGACYLDGGIKAAKRVILDFLEDEIKSKIASKEVSDYKSTLQEFIQRLGWSLPDYRIVKEIGPEHEKVFHVQVKVGKGLKKFKEVGRGHTKKEAEQYAAKKVLRIISVG